MKKCIETVRREKDGWLEGWFIICPACRCEHFLDETYEHNYNERFPSFHPSLVIDCTFGKEKYKCHSFITEGFIRFINDSDHSMRGRVVPLPFIIEKPDGQIAWDKIQWTAPIPQYRRGKTKITRDLPKPKKMSI